jgi:glycosyltransferase involved in cell wall biosynthesis
MSIACDLRKTKYVTSIQGLVSEIAKHMSADLPNSVIYGMTLRNFINLDSIYLMSKSFKKRGYNELKLLKKSANVIGRTTWDKALTRQINSSIRYFHCNESLRGEFYKHKWDYDKCEKHSMFLSQGQYSIKGLHYVLEALPLIIEKFPDIKLYIAGKDITKLKSIKDRLFITYYGKYIRKLIKKYRLGKHVVFTGPLSEKKMCERYLKSNIFICPSSIENSPNSLGEAMLLGVPSIASYVGGVPDMLVDKEEGFLYQHNVPYMLAYYVSRIFNNKELALKLSEKAKEHALRTHDRNENSKILIEIYNDILEKKAE